MKIKKIRLFSNHSEISLQIEAQLRQLLATYHFEIVEEDYDLIIAIGGDGCFLHMVQATSFNSDIYYIGINTGTLGFAQEIRAEELETFVQTLYEDGYKVEEISVQETKIDYDKSTSYIYSLNEIVIREKELNVAHFDVQIGEVDLETFVGDGILISTSFGSTAYNLSLGGSIVFNDLHTLQITPIAPLNTKSYRCLSSSIIVPETRPITIVPRKGCNNILISIDGQNHFYDQVRSIKTYVKDKKIKFLRKRDYDFTDKVNEKFLR